MTVYLYKLNIDKLSARKIRADFFIRKTSITVVQPLAVRIIINGNISYRKDICILKYIQFMRLIFLLNDDIIIFVFCK